MTTTRLLCPLQEEGWPVFVGGGAGIVLSRAAALQILSLRESSECDPLNLKWADRTHQGGDAWLGDCADASGVHIDMEYGFYPQPPGANMFQHFKDAVSFHGVEDMSSMFRALQAPASGQSFDPRCVPVFVDHKYVCLPHFIIGGVPKAGTTSLNPSLLTLTLTLTLITLPLPLPLTHPLTLTFVRRAPPRCTSI